MVDAPTTPQDMDAVLLELLEDRRLSRAERRDLKAMARQLAEHDPERLAVFRSRVFALAHDQLPESSAELRWIEDAVKALWPSAGGPQRVDARAHFSPGESCRRAIVSSFREARERARVCVFTITDNEIVDAIVAAHGRGVLVEVITDDDKALDRGSDIHELERRGVAVRTDRTEAHMHHKFAVFDGKALLTGSYNWTRSAATSNQENIIVSEDRSLVRHFERTFEQLWHAFR